MKRNVLSAAVLLLLAASTLWAAAPPAIWFQTNFDSYPGQKLGLCGPDWGDAQVIEPGTMGPWPIGSTNVFVRSSYGAACSGAQYCAMEGQQGNMIGVTVYKGIATETTRSSPPAGVGWGDRSPGQVQILYFKMKRAFDEPFPPPTVAPLHAGVYLIDSDLFNPQPILGFQANARGVKSQLILPTYNGSLVLPDGNYSSPEGDTWDWTPLDNACHEFTAVYDPNDGSAKFYVDGSTTPFSTLNAGAGRASQSVYVRDYMWYRRASADPKEIVLIDDLAVGTTAKPVVVSPLSGAFQTTATPAVTWNKAFPSQTRASYQVKICASDDPSAAAVANGDSGVLTNSLTSWTPGGALPTNTQLWAFVNETYSGPTGWSLAGNGGFYCVTVAPTTPTVTSPSGTVVGAKPAVIFSGGVLHNAFEVKITTASDGSGVVWSVSVPDSLKNGASCSQLLTPGTQYYAFARAGNPVLPDGWSAWSAASPFMVTRTGEGFDFRGMEETWGSQDIFAHTAAAPDDGFGDYCGTGRTFGAIKRQVLPDPFNLAVDLSGNPANYQPCDWWPSFENQLAYVKGSWIIPPIPNRPAPSYVADFWDIASDLSSNDIRLHRVANIDLNKGVTFMTLASGHCYEGEGCGFHGGRRVADEAQMYIMDDYGTGKCMASFRYGQGEAGICSDATNWEMEGFTDDQHYPDPRPGQGWHLVRITGRNAVVGDYTTTVWNYYLDENPTPLISTTGSMDQTVAPYGAIVDAIAIGQADGGMQGNWQYDWTGVNTDGDYAPGEWFGGGSGPAYATISAARAANIPGPCTIAGDAVITGVMTDATGNNQIGFSVQDVNTQDHAGMYIESTISANVLEGNKVNGIGGVLTMQPGVGATMQSAAFTATTDTAEALPLAMSQKSLQGYRTPPAAGLQNAGMYARICGRVTAWLPDAVGIPVIYLDDGSGLVDGRTVYGNPSALGLRIVTNQFFDGSGAVGKYYRVDGICTCETWTEGATTKTVETILAPRLEEIPEP